MRVEEVCQQPPPPSNAHLCSGLSDTRMGDSELIDGVAALGREDMQGLIVMPERGASRSIAPSSHHPSPSQRTRRHGWPGRGGRGRHRQRNTFPIRCRRNGRCRICMGKMDEKWDERRSSQADATLCQATSAPLAGARAA